MCKVADNKPLTDNQSAEVALSNYTSSHLLNSSKVDQIMLPDGHSAAGNVAYPTPISARQKAGWSVTAPGQEQTGRTP